MRPELKSALITFGKVVLFVVLTACLLVLAGFVSLLALFTHELGYLYCIWPAVLALAILVAGWLFRGVPRLVRRIASGALILCLCIMGGIGGYQYYDDSIVTVADEVELYQYQPFTDSKQIARLDQLASLRLKEDDLPKMDGATALYPLYAAFVEATYPNARYSYYSDPVRCSKTQKAYERLINREVDLILVARPSQDQIAAARAKGLEFVLTPVGREAFVFFVNARNPVRGLSVTQIQDIYGGKITDWQTVGGPRSAIKAFQRPENSGSQTMLQKIMAWHTLMPAPQADVATGMGGIIRRAADYKNYSNAIGYSFLYFATKMVHEDEIRLLEINGVAPTAQSIRDHSYPFSTEFYAVTIKGHASPQTSALIEWMRSPQGQELVEKTGYVALQ